MRTYYQLPKQVTRIFSLRLNRSEGQIYDVRDKSMGGLNQDLTCREADLSALWFATSLPALRRDVGPIYVKIGIQTRRRHPTHLRAQRSPRSVAIPESSLKSRPVHAWKDLGFALSPTNGRRVQIITLITVTVKMSVMGRGTISDSQRH